MTHFENNFVEEVTFKNSESCSISDDHCSPNNVYNCQNPKKSKISYKAQPWIKSFERTKNETQFSGCKKMIDNIVGIPFP